ncbi:uncharacterized protein LOC131594680 [Vicia villosa]|uniref:uncharacterized protein LOC131594680 n=1 Tax=Vicia villosa TaxID=3911 RepID=UPI00273C08BB|nr:uncharacterized protein LOC131594680 [Vicia villosa]XP_058722850.1 uncharacterized protein LOC131594680 [Vicia villosa]
MAAGRNVDINIEAMMRWTGAIGQAPQENVGYGGKDEFRAFGDFQRCNPPIFEGGYGPDKAHAWMREIEKIFQVVSCTDVQKVQFGTHMMTKEADVWWSNTVPRFEIEGIEVTWTLFRDVFLENYFPGDVRGKKEVRNLDLKQGREQVCGKPYDDVGKQSGFSKKPSGGGASTLIKCYRCGETGHKIVDCGVGSSRICYSCGEQGHNCAMYDKPKKDQAKGRVFALFGAETTSKDKLI